MLEEIAATLSYLPYEGIRERGVERIRISKLAACSRMRFEEAAKAVKLFSGTVEDKCAAMTYTTLFGLQALQSLKEKPAELADPAVFVEVVQRTVEKQGLEVGFCTSGLELLFLLDDEKCLGGFLIRDGDWDGHASPILPGTVKEGVRGVYYSKEYFRWPPYWWALPSFLIQWAGGEVMVLYKKN